MDFHVQVQCRRGEDPLPEEKVRLSYHGDIKKALSVKRGDIVRIAYNGRAIYREVAFGSGGATADLYVPQGVVRLSYDSIGDLGLQRDKEKKTIVKLSIVKLPSALGGMLFHWHSPDKKHMHGVRSAVYLLLLTFLVDEALSWVHVMFLDDWLRQWWLS